MVTRNASAIAQEKLTSLVMDSQGKFFGEHGECIPADSCTTGAALPAAAPAAVEAGMPCDQINLGICTEIVARTFRVQPFLNCDQPIGSSVTHATNDGCCCVVSLRPSLMYFQFSPFPAHCHCTCFDFVDEHVSIFILLHTYRRQQSTLSMPSWCRP